MDFPAVELVPGGYLSSSLAPVSLQTPQNHSETFSWVWSNSICPCSLPAPPQELQVIKWVIPHSQEFIQNAFSTTSSIASTSRPFAAGTCPAVARSTAWQSSFIPFPAILDLSLSPGMMIGALAPHGRPPRLPGSGLRHSKDMEDGNGFTNIYIYICVCVYVCMCIYSVYIYMWYIYIYITYIYIYDIYIYISNIYIYMYDKSYTCMICISCFSCSRNLPRFLYTLPFWSRSSRKPGTLAFGVFFQAVPIQVQRIQISGYLPQLNITQLLGIFHLQQIWEGDVQNPQKGTFTNPCWILPKSYLKHRSAPRYPCLSLVSCAETQNTTWGLILLFQCLQKVAPTTWSSLGGETLSFSKLVIPEPPVFARKRQQCGIGVWPECLRHGMCQKKWHEIRPCWIPSAKAKWMLIAGGNPRTSEP